MFVSNIEVNKNLAIEKCERMLTRTKKHDNIFIIIRSENMEEQIMFKLSREENEQLNAILSDCQLKTTSESVRAKKDCGSNCQGQCGESCQAACRSTCTSFI